MQQKRIIRVFASLVVESGDEKGRAYRLTKKPFFIGRRPDCEVMINDPAVSRKHAQIRYEGGKFILSDLGTPNGTFVNGERIEERQLKRGDVVRVGKLEMKLVFVAAPESCAPLTAASARQRQSQMEATALVDMEKLLRRPAEEDVTSFLDMDKILRGEVDEGIDHTAFLDMSEVLSGSGKAAVSWKKVLMFGIPAAVLLVAVLGLVMFSGDGSPVEQVETISLKIGLEERRSFPLPVKVVSTSDAAVASLRTDENILIVLGVTPGRTEVVVKDAAGKRIKLAVEVQPDEGLIRGITLPDEYKKATHQEKLQIAEKLVNDGDALASQRDTVIENHYLAFQAYVEAFLLMDTLDIKPGLYYEAKSKLKNLEYEIQELERKYFLEVVKASKTGRYDIALDNLRILMRLFPNPKGEKHALYRSLYDRFRAEELEQ